MKLELKHLAPYLPYGLNMDISHTEYAIKEAESKNRLKECKLVGINSSAEFATLCCITNIKQHNNGILYLSIVTPKPILRPLSEIDDDEENTPETISKCCYSYVEALFENHFDVFGLIEKGLAIDINTI